MAEPTTASNLDEFNAQARSFVTKAKAGGASNTAIMNTIRMKYDGFKTDQARKITPYQQAILDRQDRQDAKQDEKDAQDNWTLVDINGDGTMEWVNKKTQEVKGSEYGAGDWGELDEAGMPTADGTEAPTTEEGFDRADMLKTAEEQATREQWMSLPEDERFLKEGEADVTGRMWHSGNQQPTPEPDKKEFSGILPSIWSGIKGIPGALGEAGNKAVALNKRDKISKKALMLGESSLSDEEKKLYESYNNVSI